MTMWVTAGAVGAPGVLMLPLQKEFGWQTAEISSALGVRFMLFGLMAPFAAVLINRYGMRRVAFSALVLIVSGLALSLAMTQVWQLVLLWGVGIRPPPPPAPPPPNPHRPTPPTARHAARPPPEPT